MDRKETVAAIAGWAAVCLMSIAIVFYSARKFIRGCFSSKKEG